ncbi:MAG: P-loop NTPase [Chlamydiales bacterium]|nr:P-loop NTPase [Chlamydiales bacterium]
MIKKIKKLVAIGAGKGGVGKSTVTCHLALALKKRGFEVGVLDADVYGPSLDHMMPYDQPMSIDGHYLIPAQMCGIKLMSVAYFQRDAAVVRAPIANETIEKFLFSTVWGALDYLLIDFPPGTGDVQLTLLQKAVFAGALLVTTPQEIALLDVRKASDCFRRLQVPILGVVENMSYFQMGSERAYPLGEGGGERLARELQVQLFGKIPLEPLLSLCADQGESLFNIGENTQAAIAFSLVAQKLHQCFEGAQGLDSFELLWKKDHEKLFIEEQAGSGEEGVRINRIFQSGPAEFVIEWTDEGVSRYDLAKLEKKCPCSRCSSLKKSLSNNMSASKIYSVGRYGLKIEFSSGCKAGIFSYAFLQRAQNKVDYD